MALSWSVEASIGCGIGAIMPNTNDELLLAIFWIIFGASFYALLFSDLGTLRFMSRS